MRKANAASTIQAKFGFLDGDLKTPIHDEIVLWTDRNMESIIDTILGYPKQWTRKRIDGLNQILEALYREERKELAKQIEGIRLKPQHTEYDLERLNGYAGKVNFVASLFTENNQWRKMDDPPELSWALNEKIWEFPIMNGKYIVGSVDLKVEIEEDYSLTVSQLETDFSSSPRLDYKTKYEPFEWRVDTITRNFIFEIKTQIPSVGELIRQIRMYEEYYKGKFFVVSPDNRAEDILKEQGIGFVLYPSCQGS